MQMFSQDYYRKYTGMGIMANLAIINSYLWGLQYLYSFSSEGKVKQDVKKSIERKFDENEQKFKYLDDLPETFDHDNEENAFKMDICSYNQPRKDRPDGDPYKGYTNSNSNTV